MATTLYTVRRQKSAGADWQTINRNASELLASMNFRDAQERGFAAVEMRGTDGSVRSWTKGQ
jgi:hypothetical protein